MLRTLVIVSTVALLACRPQDPTRLSAAAPARDHRWEFEFGRITRAPTLDAVFCRARVKDNVPAGVLIERNARQGGVTCVEEAGTVLYAPVRDGGCEIPAAIAGGVEEVPFPQAATAFVRCSAVYRASAAGSRSMVIAVKADATADDHAAFSKLGIDIANLVLFDGLPVTHFAAAHDLICVEARDIGRVIDHIVAANLVDESLVRSQEYDRSCAAVSLDLTGRSWPRPGPGPASSEHPIRKSGRETPVT